ncbi:sulfate ABC transporter permease subunit CysW [Niallia oryzisoli]|uniref:sulfate ABC transporter permease subunit CysW n=1 Tax=Niallia oryzisoli TaxID=1737571 RepID=UPI003736FA69
MEPQISETIKQITTRKRKSSKESKWVKVVLIFIAILYLSLLLFIPLAAIFVKAFEKGFDVYLAAITESDALSAIRLTLLVAVIVVPLNTLFGVAAAWAVTKFRFRGKQILLSLLELPFAVSPVIAGLVFVLLFSPRGVLGPWLVDYGIKIIFSVPGIIIATIFVTVPFVARELIPVMQAQGTSEEEAAVSLGANGWQMFWRVTLPNIKWGLLYGMILCNARAIGEFGAVSVVSGRIRGLTNTMPLHVEILYNEYQFSASFAVASLMSIMAMITLIIKSMIEWKTNKQEGKGV